MMQIGAADRHLLSHAARKVLCQRIPLGRLGEPVDIAGPAVFLASDLARYVTGVTLPVDGGFLAN